MTALALLHLLLAPLLLGAAVLRACGIGFRTDRLAFLGWATATGLLLTGLGLFLWILVGLPFAAFLPVPLGVAAGAALLARVRRREVAPADPTRVGSGRGARALLGLALVATILLACDRALLISRLPVLLGDETTHFANEAKAILAAGGFGARYAELVLPPNWVMHADYPPLVTMLHLWTYLHAGEVVHHLNRLPLQIATPALLLVLAAALRLRVGAVFAALLVLLFGAAVQTREATINAAADNLLAFGLLLVTDGYDRWRRSGDRRLLALFAIGLVLLVASKNEGMMLLLCVAAGVALDAALRARATDAVPRVRTGRGTLAAFGAAALLLVGQVVFNRVHGLENDLLTTQAQAPIWTRIVEQAAAHVGPTLAGFREFVFLDLHDAGGLTALFCAALVLAPRRTLGGRDRAIAVAVLLAAAGYFLVYLGTPHDIEWHLRFSIQRLLYHLTPAATLVAASTLAALRERAAPQTSSAA